MRHFHCWCRAGAGDAARWPTCSLVQHFDWTKLPCYAHCTAFHPDILGEGLCCISFSKTLVFEVVVCVLMVAFPFSYNIALPWSGINLVLWDHQIMSVSSFYLGIHPYSLDFWQWCAYIYAAMLKGLVVSILFLKLLTALAGWLGRLTLRSYNFRRMQQKWNQYA